MVWEMKKVNKEQKNIIKRRVRVKEVRSDIRSMAVWRISADLSPRNYKKLNTYIPTDNIQPAHKHI